MTTRKLTIIVGVLIFIGAIFLFRFLSAGPDKPEQIFTNGVASVGVPVIEANPKSITAQVSFTGRVIPEDEVELYAEVTGNFIQASKTFKAGIFFRKGEVILMIDDREQKQSVLTQKSQFQSLLAQTLADINIDYPEEYSAWESYLEDMSLDSEIAPLPSSTNKKFELFLIGRNIKSTYFGIKQSEIRLSKYTIKAPYDGVVTESLLDAGTLVRVGQKLGEFTKTSVYEIEASINASDRFFIKTGDVVELTLEGTNLQTISAKVVRKNARIDANTQTLLIYLQARGGDILAGQYVSGSISGEKFEDVQKVATKSLVRNNMVFVASDSLAVIKPIQLIKSAKDSSIVKGLSAGDLVIDEFHDASFEGTKVNPLKN